MGFLKIAFIWAFFFLRNEKFSYQDALRVMIMQGGDTDTNAAIVGGLIGAARGLSAFTPRQIEALLSVRPDLPGFNGRPRPGFLVPGLYLPQLLNSVYHNAPQTLKYANKAHVPQYKAQLDTY